MNVSAKYFLVPAFRSPCGGSGIFSQLFFRLAIVLLGFRTLVITLIAPFAGVIVSLQRRV